MENRLTTEELHEILNSSIDFGGHESLLRKYLIDQVERYDAGLDDPRKIAYEIAGLMSARSMTGLPNNNPFMMVLLLAGELELPEPHWSPSASWDELKRLIERLG